MLEKTNKGEFYTLHSRISMPLMDVNLLPFGMIIEAVLVGLRGAWSHGICIMPM